MKALKLGYILPFLVVLLISPFLFENVYAADDTVVAYYAFSNGDNSNVGLNNVHPSATTADSAEGQSFTMTTDAYLTEFTVGLKRVGSPSAYMRGYLYSSGTNYNAAYNASALLATSTNDVAMSDVDLTVENVTFYFDQTYQMLTGYNYTILVTCYNATLCDSSNEVNILLDITSSSYTTGRHQYYESSASASSATYDAPFEVKGNEDPAVGPTPTPTAAPDDWYDDENMAAIASYVVILALIFIPVGILAKTANLGVIGAIVGLAIGVGLSYLLFPSIVPMWLVFLVAIGIVALLYRQVQR